MSEIKKEVLDLSEKIGKGLSLDGNVVTASDGLYESLLPEGVSMDLLERVQAHDTEVLAATALAVGQLGNKAMKKDETLNKISLVMPTVGKDTFGFAYDRSRQVRDAAPGTEGAGMKTKYGIMSISVDKYGAGNRGEVGAVKTFLSAEAAEMLK
jgi:hypothetical protein